MKAQTLIAKTLAAVAFALVIHAASGDAASASVLSGKVRSGSIPIVGSTVTLYGGLVICPEGMGAPCSSQSLPLAKATTNSHGQFTIDLAKAGPKLPGSVQTGNRWDPGSLYLIARGGNAGEGSNSATALMLALGDAPSSRNVTINELTTVVAAFTYAHFTTDPSWASGAAPASALVDQESGRLRPVFNEGANSPATINTLADIISACVHSTGAKSSGCTSLFAATPPVGRPRCLFTSAAPTDTLIALENIALWPQRNVAQLFGLLPAKPPYLPVLYSRPEAFIISIELKRGGLNRPSEIAFDRQDGSMWVANEGGDSVVQLSTAAQNFGAPLSPPGGFKGGGLHSPTAIKFISVDSAGAIESGGTRMAGVPRASTLWVTNRLSDSLTEILLPTPGDKASPSLRQISGNGLKAPIDLMELGGVQSVRVGDRMEPVQFVAVANSQANVVSLFKALDGSACGKPIQVPGLKHAQAIGPGANGIFVADASGDSLFEVKPPKSIVMVTQQITDVCSGAEFLGPISKGRLNSPKSIVAGSASIVVTNNGNDTVSVFRSKYPTTPQSSEDLRSIRLEAEELPGSPFRGGGIRGPAGIVTDGDVNAWIANNAPGANSISEIAHVTNIFERDLDLTGMPLSAEHGFSGAGLNRPLGIAIDSAGDVWVTNQAGNSVTVFVGMARPRF